MSPMVLCSKLLSMTAVVADFDLGKQSTLGLIRFQQDQ
jgi:hypothetical protein